MIAHVKACKSSGSILKRLVNEFLRVFQQLQSVADRADRRFMPTIFLGRRFANLGGARHSLKIFRNIDEGHPWLKAYDARLGPVDTYLIQRAMAAMAARVTTAL